MISIEDNNILESCENDIHLSYAKRFIYLYKKATDDIIGVSELEVLLLSKRMSL